MAFSRWLGSVIRTSRSSTKYYELGEEKESQTTWKTKSAVAEIKNAAGGLVVSDPGVLGGTPVFLVPLYPFGVFNVWRIMRSGAHDLERGGKTVWGGREYVLQARD